MQVQATDREEVGGHSVGYTTYGLIVLMTYAKDVGNKSIIITSLNSLPSLLSDKKMSDSDKRELIRIAAGDRITLEELEEFIQEVESDEAASEKVFYDLSELQYQFIRDRIIPGINEKQ